MESAAVGRGAPGRAPAFIITIDTEGDNAWARPEADTTRNSAFLPRFQELCEAYGLKPTYLTNHEMALCPTFRALARDVLARGAGEIGMHLHAWSSPPLDAALTAADRLHQPFLIEYPEPAMRAKVRAMTATLEDTFGVKMVSHRAGRWSFDHRYAAILIDEGYRVDCSVTPLVDWRGTRGAPSGRGGTDYSCFPHDAYWLDASDVSRPGDSPLLEVPMTVLPGAETAARRASRALAALRRPTPLGAAAAPIRRVLDRISPSVRWLRPNGRNRSDLLAIIGQVVAEGRGHAEFMLHSSELMPGGSPTFRTEAQVEALYGDLHALFGAVREARLVPATLAEFHAATTAGAAGAEVRAGGYDA